MRFQTVVAIAIAIPAFSIQAAAQGAAPADHAAHPAAPGDAAPAAPDHAQHGAMPADGAAGAPPPDGAAPPIDHAQHGAMPAADAGAPPQPDHAAHAAMPAADHAAHAMTGALGPYPMTRDASGTAWQPDSTPMEAIHGQYGVWSTMLHGFANVIAADQGGPRGDSKIVSQSMLMGMAHRPLGSGSLMLRGMLSLDPTMGKDGYPLLFQTGETADGVTPLIDRQHPHDFFMELAAVYSHPLSADTSVFLYAGYPGEPALGPPAFMHRFSGMDNPDAPLGHHWLDATHITFGVLTGGLVWRGLKLEGSLFNGREPDEHRWNFDPLRLDSTALRLTWNPNANWSMQASWGRINSPEALEPDIDQQRITASVTYNVPLASGNWQTTFAWGRNDKQPGDSTNALLLESALRWNAHTVFGRIEHTEKDELFGEGEPLHDQTFGVTKFSLGYVYDIPVTQHVKVGVGAVGSAYAFPSELDPYYGSDPLSGTLFLRVKLY
jgi:hypothetical protein